MPRASHVESGDGCVAPDLVKVSEIFLVPGSFLVAALGTADSNPHRAAVSVLGLIVSVLWLACAREAHLELGTRELRGSRRMRILAGLPVVFIVGWLVSTVVHLVLWNRAIVA